MKMKKQMRIDDLAVTVNNLAVVVKKGFHDMNRKMATKAEMQKGFQTMEDRMATKAEMQKGFQTMEDRMATKVEMQKGFQTMEDRMATKEMVKTSIDDFAVMVQKGFMEIKHEMATKDMLKLVIEGVDIVREDVRDIKITLGPLARTVAALETDMQHLTARVTRLEQKSGLVKK